MSMANYTDWTAAVHAELTSRNMDITEAYDWFSFRACYELYDMTPVASVDDYEQWMRDNVNV
jgi:hypothetical protein